MRSVTLVYKDHSVNVTDIPDGEKVNLDWYAKTIEDDIASGKLVKDTKIREMINTSMAEKDKDYRAITSEDMLVIHPETETFDVYARGFGTED